MNNKHLIPTWRNRYVFTIDSLQSICKKCKISKALNIGTGEGDYDAGIAGMVTTLIACDINAEDIHHAQIINATIPNLKYEVIDALQTNYPSCEFDLIICTEVIEHVGDADALLNEISRILKPNGFVIMTFPTTSFPITYDAINYIAQKLKYKMPFIKQGAYAFGHDYLINFDQFCHQANTLGLTVVKRLNLSGYLIGLLEMYWIGWLQKILKTNSGNNKQVENKKLHYVPHDNQPTPYSVITDAIIKIDRVFISNKKPSINVGLVIQKINEPWL